MRILKQSPTTPARTATEKNPPSPTHVHTKKLKHPKIQKTQSKNNYKNNNKKHEKPQLQILGPICRGILDLPFKPVVAFATASSESAALKNKK